MVWHHSLLMKGSKFLMSDHEVWRTGGSWGAPGLSRDYVIIARPIKDWLSARQSSFHVLARMLSSFRLLKRLYVYIPHYNTAAMIQSRCQIVCLHILIHMNSGSNWSNGDTARQVVMFIFSNPLLCLILMSCGFADDESSHQSSLLIYTSYIRAL